MNLSPEIRELAVLLARAHRGQALTAQEELRIRQILAKESPIAWSLPWGELLRVGRITLSYEVFMGQALGESVA